MKRMLFLFLCLICVKLSQGKSSYELSTPPPTDTVPVIISILDDDAAVYHNLSIALKSMPGVRYVAYCSNHATFLLYIDPNVYASAHAFVEQVKLDNSLPFLKEMPGSLNELLKFCSFGNASEAEDLKKQQ